MIVLVFIALLVGLCLHISITGKYIYTKEKCKRMNIAEPKYPLDQLILSLSIAVISIIMIITNREFIPGLVAFIITFVASTMALTCDLIMFFGTRNEEK